MARVEAMPEGRPARDVLAWSRATVEAALQEAVDTLPASMQRIAAYQLGWQDQHGDPTVARGGKAVRPALVLVAAEAAGGAPASAVPAAVAVELVHNFSLLHDDVMDGDTTRRHRLTAWTVFGSGEAILAGDALLTLALTVLADSGHPAAQEQLRTLTGAVQELIDGQSADLAFEQRSDVELAECLRMARGKTGALLECACVLGALCGGDPEQVEQLRGFGDHLGLAFQLVDDLLGIWGDPAVTGKPTHSDLRSRKKTLPVVAALSSGTAAGREFEAIYHSEEPLCGARLLRAAELVDRAGGRELSQARADYLLARALRHLDSAKLTAQGSAELDSLARLITHRTH